jgi:hypothetical protein
LGRARSCGRVALLTVPAVLVIVAQGLRLNAWSAGGEVRDELGPQAALPVCGGQASE